MLDERQTLTRLPARARKAFGFFSGDRYRLWLAEDHLLYVRISHYSEYCKRFYFNDIQAITVCRTSAGKRMNTALIIVGAVLVLIGVSLTAAEGWPFALIPGIPAGILGLLLLWNVLLGPTCVCRLYTTVQAEDIVAMRRLRRAEATLLIVVPLIEAVQGAFGPEELSQAADSPGAVETLLPASHAVDESVPGARTRVRSSMGMGAVSERHEHGSYHGAFFALLLVLAVSCVIDVFWQNMVKNIIDAFVYLATIMVGILAVTKQRDSDMDRGVRNAAGWGLGVVFAVFMLGMMMGLIYGMMNPELFVSGDFQNFDVKIEGAAFPVLFAIEAVVFALSAALGYLRLMRFRANHARRQSPPPVSLSGEGSRQEVGS